MVSPDEMLVYARECMRQRPQLTETELRAFLEAKYIHGADPLAGGVGAVDNPFDWLSGLASIFRGVTKLWNPSVMDVTGIKDIINGVITIVSDEPVAFE